MCCGVRKSEEKKKKREIKIEKPRLLLGKKKNGGGGARRVNTCTSFSLLKGSRLLIKNGSEGWKGK